LDALLQQKLLLLLPLSLRRIRLQLCLMRRQLCRMLLPLLLAGGRACLALGF
jgi:hypothetical protein